MVEEYNTLIANHTWDFIPPPSPSHNIIGCKWVFKVKQKPDGSIDYLKSCIVARGYSQCEGMDYDEMFNPIVKLVTIKMILSITVFLQWLIRHIDVNNAFVHGYLH